MVTYKDRDGGEYVMVGRTADWMTNQQKYWYIEGLLMPVIPIIPHENIGILVYRIDAHP